ncbi:hypothetical protein D3C78_1941430 [compost metagenome]
MTKQRLDKSIHCCSVTKAKSNPIVYGRSAAMEALGKTTQVAVVVVRLRWTLDTGYLGPFDKL